MTAYLLPIVAAIGAVAHVYFAYQEIVGWSSSFVERAAPAWIDRNDMRATESHIRWSRSLAANVGAYNLVLAIGLGWTAVAGDPLRHPLAIFFSVWLVTAAVAAAFTRVYVACAVQGLLGALLLAAALWA